MPIFEEQVVKASRYIKYVKKDDKIIAFRIKYPVMQTLLYIIITLASVAGAIVTAVYLNKKMLELYIAFFIFIACLVVFLTFASLVVRNQFKLICENEAFILKQPFKPEKVLPCRNVEQVDVTKFYSNRKSLRYLIIFWSRDGQRYFYFYNNGFLLKKDVLTKLLDTYQIPYKIHQ